MQGTAVEQGSIADAVSQYQCNQPHGDHSMSKHLSILTAGLFGLTLMFSGLGSALAGDGNGCGSKNKDTTAVVDQAAAPRA